MKNITAVLLMLTLSACASASTPNCIHNDAEGDAFEACDPLKPVNHRIFSFNLAADEYVVGPVAHTYHEAPDWFRYGMGNFLTNLSEPMNFVNGALQGDVTGAMTSFWRFVFNTTFGLGGVRDFAGENGLKYQDTDFGKTLVVYGVSEGAYVVLPLIGPSSVRDTTGQVVDVFLDPVGWVISTPWQVAQGVTNGIVERDDQDPLIQQFYYDSLEPYSATRAAYLQHEGINQ